MRETVSDLVLIGTLKEKSSLNVKNNIEILNKTFEDGTTYSVARGRIVMESNGGEYSLDIYIQDHFAVLNDNGKHKGNKYYGGIADVANIELGTKLEIEIKTDRFNDYRNKRGTVSSIDCFKVKNIKVVADDIDDKFEGKIEGVIGKILPEIVNEEETGRLKVEFIGINYKDEALPHNLYVSEDLKNDFEIECKVGDTTMFYIEIKSQSYGAPEQPRNGGFGRKIEVKNGFTRAEWTIVGSEKSYDDDMVNKSGESLIIDPKDVQKALEERAVKLEAIENNTTTNNTKSSGLKGSAKFIKVDDPEDCPF